MSTSLFAPVAARQSFANLNAEQEAQPREMKVGPEATAALDRQLTALDGVLSEARPLDQEGVVWRKLPDVPYYGLLGGLRLEVDSVVPPSAMGSSNQMDAELEVRAGERIGPVVSPQVFRKLVSERCGHHHLGHEPLFSETSAQPTAGGATSGTGTGNTAVGSQLPVVELGVWVEGLSDAFATLESRWRRDEGRNEERHGESTVMPFEGFYVICQQHLALRSVSAAFFVEGPRLCTFIASDNLAVRSRFNDAIGALGGSPQWIDGALFESSDANDTAQLPLVHALFDALCNLPWADVVRQEIGASSRDPQSSLPMAPSSRVTGRVTLLSSYPVAGAAWKPLQLRREDPVRLQQDGPSVGAKRSRRTTEDEADAEGVRGDAPPSVLFRWSWTAVGGSGGTSQLILPTAVQALLGILMDPAALPTQEGDVAPFRLLFDGNATAVGPGGTKVGIVATDMSRRARGARELGAGVQSDGGGVMIRDTTTSFLPLLCFSRLSSEGWVDLKTLAIQGVDDDEDDETPPEAEFYPTELRVDPGRRGEELPCVIDVTVLRVLDGEELK